MDRASRASAYNLVPLPYNRVSVQRVDFALTESSIHNFLLGKEAYFQTDYVVLKAARECAVAEVDKGACDLFGPITAVDVLSLSGSCRWIDDSTVDPGIPSSLAEKARKNGVSRSETLIVRGLYEHVNFIHRPFPAVIDIFDLAPPEPPRLLDSVQRVLAYKDLPAVVLNPRLQSILELIPAANGKPILLPCGVSQLKRAVSAFYLDERPARRDWVLVGCERSLRIHRHFYGDEPPRVELCPRRLFKPGTAPALMRCCALERGFELRGRMAILPWGCDLATVEAALRAVLD